MASPAEQDKVQALQGTLYRAAKADPGRRFHALHDKVYRRDVLERAWEQVRRNRGAPGIDQTTIADVERYGVARLLDELTADLKEGSYRPLPARRVLIAKPGTSELRPLSIPAVRDRIVQTALKIVIEPIFEAQFLPCSFGFRPKRGVHDALQVLIDESWRGNRWVVETDVASCFEAIPQDRLMQAIEERICDRQVLKLLRGLLRAGVMEDGVVKGSVTGTPQGGVVSPLLANVYLHRLDRAWQTQGVGVLVRYCDDLVVLCRTRREAERALTALTAILAELGLAPKASKTRIVHLREKGEGLDFLGFHHRWVRAESQRHRHVLFLARWPTNKAMQHARDRIRELNGPAQAAASDRGDRAGRQPRPARLGGVLPLWQLRPAPREAQELRADAPRAGGGQAPSPVTGVRLVGRGLPVTQPARPDRPERDRRCPQAVRSWRGKAECRR